MNQNKKELIGFINSIFWFSMDASWMMTWNTLALVLILPTVVSGIWLVFMEKRKDIMLADCATFCWIIMNCGWLVSEILEIPVILWASKIALFCSVILLGVCFYLSEDYLKTIQGFKRFRMKQLRGFANQKLSTK